MIKENIESIVLRLRQSMGHRPNFVSRLPRENRLQQGVL